MRNELLYLTNPAGRRRKSRSSKRRNKKRGQTVIRIAANPARRSRKRRGRRGGHRAFAFRRNPIALAPRGFGANVLTPALAGALGATAIDAAVGYLPIPSQFLQGRFASLTKMVVALGVATFGGRVTKRSGLIKAVGVGAFTCALHDLIRSGISQYAPNVKLGEFVTDGMGGLNLNVVPMLPMTAEDLGSMGQITQGDPQQFGGTQEVVYADDGSGSQQ